MIIEIPTTKQVNVKYLKIDIPMRYGDEDVPYDFPLRENDNWTAIIDLDTFKIEGWPQGKSGELSTKVCDEGTYALLDENKQTVKEISDCYVPNKVIPGEFGDYIHLKIDESGKVTNMPKELNFDEFLKQSEEY
ncbi:hypothetical protein [Rodentibacter pneumotropicus]|uniref:Uncharacterized protein n=1 Tax=Rodentibacter pneumotropicus TaxID=758 RepID=A0A4S2QK36_9PAST|nr:hypothetical protein [Rodentibacter pneumotropicus]THA16815.1 hypothetical protein D3M76_02750 [Rodentibacter pneumotropicus]